MSYSVPHSYYRCPIIRMKAQGVMDDFLPFYASCVESLCPCDEGAFRNGFRNMLSTQMFRAEYKALTSANKKTVDNHITEIAGKVLALYWIDANGVVYPSQSCDIVLEKHDQPAFFKNLCLNFQFPNGAQKPQTIQERLNDGIRCKSLHFILALAKKASDACFNLTIEEIGYYVLSSLEVLQGKASVKEVYDAIVKDRHDGKVRKVSRNPNEAWAFQHIREQLNLLQLANLIRLAHGYVYLNKSEMPTINLFVAELDKPLRFDIYSMPFDTVEARAKVIRDWQEYNGGVYVMNGAIQTNVSTMTTAISVPQTNQGGIVPTPVSIVPTNAEVGDEGEYLVLKMEKARVAATHPHLTNKVICLGKQKGLGYDITSVEAGENPSAPEFARLIEVKTSIRSTVPDIDSEGWFDTVNVTRKEWVAASQYQSAFNIYRVYITPLGTLVYKIGNPIAKEQSKSVVFTPTSYRMDFWKSAIDKDYNNEAKQQA